MARPDPQLAAYRYLLDNARAMLLAARDGRWDDLSRLDVDRALIFSQVVEADLISTQPEDITAKTDLIQSILECDEQTKALAQIWQQELREVLGSMDNERRLADAYRSG